MKHTTTCPTCWEPFHYADDLAGQAVTCPACQTEFTLNSEVTPRPGWLQRFLCLGLVIFALLFALLLLTSKLDLAPAATLGRPHFGTRAEILAGKGNLWPQDVTVAPVKDWPRDKAGPPVLKPLPPPVIVPGANSRSAGKALAPLAVPDLAVPEPQAPGDSLAGKARTLDGARFLPLTLPADLIRAACWSPDGKAFYCAEKTGRIRRVTRAGLTEAARLDLGGPCAGLAFSELGLVVAPADRKELWLLHPQTLRVTRRIALPELPGAVTAVPDLGLAFVPASEPCRSLYWVDLASGRLWLYDQDSFPPATLAYRAVTVAPGGKHLFALHKSLLLRFRIDLEALVFEDSVPIADSPGPVCIGPDGQRIGVPATAGNRGPAPYATLIFATNSLQKPLFALETGPFPQALAFARDGRIFGQNYETTLLVHDAQGKRLAAYPFTPEGDTPRLLVPAPTGNGVLTLGRATVALIELPD